MVNKELLQEIEDYCELNEIEVPKTLNEALRSGFTILKFGMPNSASKSTEKVVEVIKEVIKEIEVEKIVEVIKEVPVERIIEVEKNINIKVDGHNVNYMEYIDQLNNDIANLEVGNKKMSKELLDSNNKSEGLEKELLDYKTRLKYCINQKKSGLDIYGE
jgi:hypothetical protein